MVAHLWCADPCVATCSSGMVTVGLFAFLASWNGFVSPLILLSDQNKFHIASGGGQPGTAELRCDQLWSLEVGAVMTAISCLVLFLLLKGFMFDVRGFMSGALRR